MKKRISGILLSLLLVFSTVPAGALAQEETPADYGTPGVDYAEGEAIVYVKGGAQALRSPNALGRSAAPAYETEELMTVEDTATSADTGSPLLRSAAVEAGRSLVLVRSGQDTGSLIAELESNPNVDFAEPNYYVEAYTTGEPTDPGYAYQWALRNQLNNKAPAAPNPAVDINAVEAWSKAGTDNTPVVAVLDSGVDYNHPDLKEVMWNEGMNHEPLTQMGGGTYGYNAVGGLEGERGTNDPMDTSVGHGTHCAGIIGARWNNSLGVAGVSPAVKIMAVRFLGSGNVGTVDAAIKGYAYIQAAAKDGVKVAAVNNSWGPGNYAGRELRSVSTAVTAIGQEFGVVSCFAAGNSNTNNDLNSGGNISSPYAIRVGAMDSEGYRSGFSCYGEKTVDVFAPGSQILSATTTNTKGFAMNLHTMPAQYLPQLQDAADNYFYEDFEGADPKVGMRLLDAQGNIVENVTGSALSPGYASDKGLQLSLDKIENGQGFAIELVFNRSDLAGIDRSSPFYMAFQGGCDNAMYGQTLLVQYQNAAGEWTGINSTQVLSTDEAGQPTDYLPARLRMYDHNWTQSSQEVNLPDFGQYGSTDPSSKVTLRLVPMPASEDQPGVMSGRDDSKSALFRLDDLGFGKKASDYFYSDGTSMATPVVAGMAALLSATFDSQATRAGHAAEICARIKGGVNRAEAQDLVNMSVSDGFVDFGAAFDQSQCVPVLNDLKIENGMATLSGYFFGSAQGAVTVAGQPAAIVENGWSDNSITFTLPEGLTGEREVMVTRPGEETKYGRASFAISAGTRNYTTLTAPDLKLGESSGYPLRSADLIPTAMAATDSKIAYLGAMLETDALHLSLYDISSGTWSPESIALPEEGNFMKVDTLYSLTGGKTKFYFLYNIQEGGEGLVKIGTYDPGSSSWTTVRAEDLDGSERLVVYKDQLLAVGGNTFTNEEGSGISGQAKASVKVVNPQTGKTTGSLPDMPQGRSSAMVSASGSTLMVRGGTNGIMSPEPVTYANTLSFDGTAWTEHPDQFLVDNPAFDKSQTLDCAFGTVNHGMIGVGPVSGLGTDGMLDTWSFRDGVWSGDATRLYSQTKTTQTIGAASGSQFYVLGYTGNSAEPLVFRATTVDYTGPAADPGSDTPTPTVKPEPSVNPNPTVQPTDHNGGKNAGTGLFDTTAGMSLAIAAILLIAAGGGFVVYRKRKNS
ncbi:S8 family serine peptidase [Eubacterium sp. 1001713B170207_170306_E7]|uniref:S8 family serine peptidase n=1 Tax=Eubacterium sp. 1001713B170207_170306_E7 TaxID=2787097 RepID=UPI001896C6CA|nr:S8 family serine peptidase [Eubacterium sp. 1001713B170207_170306_E7]